MQHRGSQGWKVGREEWGSVWAGYEHGEGRMEEEEVNSSTDPHSVFLSPVLQQQNVPRYCPRIRTKITLRKPGSYFGLITFGLIN